MKKNVLRGRRCRVCGRRFVKCRRMVGNVHCKLPPKRCGYCYLYCKTRH